MQLDGSSPETVFTLNDDCSFQAVNGPYAGSRSSYRSNLIGNGVFLNDFNEALYCQVALGGPQAQLVCSVDGNSGSTTLNDDDWYVGATASDRCCRCDFTANLIPVV
jgi:hypothetical protein